MITKTIRKLFHDRKAVTALEYGLIAAAVAGTVVTGFSFLSNNLSNMFVSIGNSL